MQKQQGLSSQLLTQGHNQPVSVFCRVDIRLEFVKFVQTWNESVHKGKGELR